jgi:hypothetical protein
MTQAIFILYLEWLLKMFPHTTTLLIVDRSKTHYGETIATWLADNHARPLGEKIHIEFIHEGMTSVHQVCDIGVNKTIKQVVKQQYFAFRNSSIEGKSARDLVGSVFTVPREDLVLMIEAAFDHIYHQNEKKRSIHATIAQCGQDRWADDTSAFERHLASLDENKVYGHMTKSACSLKLF